ncbi:MAG: mechanosensitive ion channel family protein [Verrucomicrobiota bacterium]
MPTRSLLTLSVLLLFAASPVLAQNNTANNAEPTPAESTEAAADKSALTTGDPSITAGQLNLLLTPLTKEELLTEADAWRDLLKDKAQAISEAEVKGNSSPDTLKSLREEKAILVNHLKTVIRAYEKKGGDSTELKQYVRVVSGEQFDFTNPVATASAIKNWLTAKDGGALVLRNIIRFAIIILVFWIIGFFIARLVRKATSRTKELSDLLKNFINNTVRRTVLFIGILVALSSIGVNISALLALIGGSAFIIGFALQDTLGNFAAGLMVLIYRPFDVGDVVDVGGVSGKVDKVSLVSTTIRTFDNKVVLVPNKKVWGEVITNSSASARRRVDMVFGIGYDDNTEKAQSILEKIVNDHELVLDDPEPVIKLHELADSSVNFICRPWTKTEDYWTVFWDVTNRVKAEFDTNDISIPYPQQDVHIYQQAPNP